MIRKTAFIALAIAVGLIAFVPSVMGYGAYVRYGWPMLLLVALPVVLAVAILELIDAYRYGRFRKSRFPVIRLALFLGLAFALGRITGHHVRRFHCQRTCRACQPLFAAARTYKAQHGEYPTELALLGEQVLGEMPAGMDIQQGKITQSGIDTEILHQADAGVYLTRNHFLCVVPVERPFFMSITRFDAYARGVADPDWTYCSWTWFFWKL